MGSEASNPEVDAPESVDAADMDGDGDVDLVVTSSYTNQLLWFENDGSGGFTGHLIATEAASLTLTQTLDFDGDGDLDVIAKSGWDVNARITLYANDGAQNFSGTTLDDSLADPRAFTATDVDNDGDTDVVVTQGGTVDCDAPPWSPMCWDAPKFDNDLVWLENNGDAGFEKQIIATDINYQHVAAGRVSGDCALDVFAAGFNAVSLINVE